MEARQAKLLFIGFLGLAAAITYNALFLQAGATRTALGAGAGELPRAKAAAEERAPATPEEAERSRIKAIQRELTAKGYDPGPTDAAMGYFTRAAIIAYEDDHGLTVTGEPRPELLEHLVLGATVTAPAKPPAPSEETLALIKAVQQILADQGYAPGAVDGVMGAETRAAIKAFERDNGLDQTGRISGKLLHKIIGATGVRITTSSLD